MYMYLHVYLYMYMYMYKLESAWPIFQILNPKPHNPQHTQHFTNISQTSHKHFIKTNHIHPNPKPIITINHIHPNLKPIRTINLKPKSKKKTPIFQQALSC